MGATRQPPAGPGREESSFAAPPPRLEVRRGEVHLWRIHLDAPPARVAALQAVTSAEERERSRRFHAAQHGVHHTVAHGSLRLLLGRYVGAAPERLGFVRGPAGKPALALDAAVEFNLSHAGALALCAVSLRAVGVDVERVRGGFDDVAERWFTPSEVGALRATAPGARDEAFFRYWTLKEAYLKLTGAGLSTPLDSFEVVPSPSGAASARSTRTGAPLPCHLLGFSPERGHVAALASVDRVERVRRWDGDLLAPGC